MKRLKTGRQNSLRIIGGSLRRRKITFPDTEGLKPTSDRVRETLFNWLQDSIKASTCIDLFAGSGALGIEALSRGAERAVFIEKDTAAAKAIEQNLNRLGLETGEVTKCEAIRWLQSTKLVKAKFTIAFIDPPFVDDICQVCNQLANSDFLQVSGKIYIEAGAQLPEADLPGNWMKLKQKKAGQVHYYLFENCAVF